jgi:hypothetical protein
MRFWAGPILVLIVGLIIFAYIHDGPPYWEWSDFFDREWHHEKIIGLLVSAGLIIFALGSRR